MTKIEISDKKINVYGHSGYEERGKDIVCASISTLVESTYLYLKATNNDVNSLEEDARFEIIFKKINKNGAAIINEFKKMIKDIENQYPNYVRSEEI